MPKNRAELSEMSPAPGPPPRWNCGRARRRRCRAKEKAGARDPQTQRFGDRSREPHVSMATTSSDQNYLFFSPVMRTDIPQNYSALLRNKSRGIQFASSEGSSK